MVSLLAFQGLNHYCPTSNKLPVLPLSSITLPSLLSFLFWKRQNSFCSPPAIQFSLLAATCLRSFGNRGRARPSFPLLYITLASRKLKWPLLLLVFLEDPPSPPAPTQTQAHVKGLAHSVPRYCLESFLEALTGSAFRHVNRCSEKQTSECCGWTGYLPLLNFHSTLLVTNLVTPEFRAGSVSEAHVATPQSSV